MTITLELTPEEATALRRRAAATGTDVEAVLRGLIAALAPPPAPPAAKEFEEDPEERDREQAELRANLDRWRAEQGRPPLG